jgi:hypothetical protein
LSLAGAAVAFRWHNHCSGWPILRGLGAKTPRHLNPERFSPERFSPERSTLAGGCFLYILELGDLDGSFGELGGDFWFSAHGFDETVKGATYISARRSSLSSRPKTTILVEPGHRSPTNCREFKLSCPLLTC